MSGQAELRLPACLARSPLALLTPPLNHRRRRPLLLLQVFLEDAGFDWKILGPDVQDFEYVAWQVKRQAGVGWGGGGMAGAFTASRPGSGRVCKRTAWQAAVQGTRPSDWPAHSLSRAACLP